MKAGCYISGKALRKEAALSEQETVIRAVKGSYSSRKLFTGLAKAALMA